MTNPITKLLKDHPNYITLKVGRDVLEHWASLLDQALRDSGDNMCVESCGNDGIGKQRLFTNTSLHGVCTTGAQA